MKHQSKFLLHWAPDISGQFRVYWSLVGGNGEVQCQSSQGSRDITDAKRAIYEAQCAMIANGLAGDTGIVSRSVQKPRPLTIVGPGRRPKHADTVHDQTGNSEFPGAT